MFVNELSREQLIEVKQNYMAQLDDEGVFNSVVYNQPTWDEIYNRGVSWGELADADALIPDAVVFDVYGGVEFVPDDFFVSAN